jgi:putative hydrolase of the HAD superfamily
MPPASTPFDDHAALGALAVSFDFGQTLAELDPVMLALRVGERGAAITPEQVRDALPGAWRRYDEAIAAGLGGHPWKLLMRGLLEGAVQGAARDALVDWLWDEQPRKNLWRRPVPGMIDLVRDLGRAGVPVAVLSNSEGRLAELVDELGWGPHFVAVADSGRLDMEKPDRRIFEWTAERLGVPIDRVVHVGDSWQADVLGALGAGMRAVWFSSVEAGAEVAARLEGDRERVVHCRDAADLADALEAWGLPVRPTLRIEVPAFV